MSDELMKAIDEIKEEHKDFRSAISTVITQQAVQNEQLGSISKVLEKVAIQHDKRINNLEQHKTETSTYWSIIKWIGGPTVVSVWLSLIGYVISRLTGQ